MNIWFIIFICTIPTILSARIFRINNQCDQKLWFGTQGKPLIYSGGFEVNARSTKDISVPDGWVSGRIWPRTNCRSVNGKFTCSTGDCGAPTNGYGMACNGIGGQPPATLAEFTLNGWGGSDFYDLSNVDGNTISMTIRPIPGQYTRVNNPSLGKYNCGTATCIFDPNRCPPELQMDDGTGRKICASICAAIHNAQQRARHVHLQKIYNNPDTRSLVSPHDKVTPGRKCYVEKWPRSTQNTRYDEVFKSQCSDAYSWQFDDLASTFQCSKANYEIILCPDSNPVKSGEPGSNIQWNGKNWAMSCDFRGNDLTNVQISSHLCSRKCAEIQGCTHFTWTRYKGGTCWMKTGTVSKKDALTTNDQTMMCGVMNEEQEKNKGSTIQWNGKNWAMACDFHGKDLSKVQTTAELCGSKCVETQGCTHFTWARHNGGTCWMKTGAVCQKDAFATNDPTMVCGIRDDGQEKNRNLTIQWNGKNWAMSCDFRRNDLSYVQTSREFCGKKCAETPGCTHFTWTRYKGGTCWMKTGAVSKNDAFATNDPTMMCGVLTHA
ncbi:unnamed protein product [Rotaria sp. Silwood1]|nr:unnamed protein product [Rotaria sp. Silwood1]CAF3415355.1 unnamed protein product [Rotaria sp. Silwood1]CAF4697325.1 unnamed protein product [Rotaria sp. Silwood1]CAF4795476.1 unnamed protein product [Rotaria sp. Silwood1]